VLRTVKREEKAALGLKKKRVILGGGGGSLVVDVRYERPTLGGAETERKGGALEERVGKKNRGSGFKYGFGGGA